MSKQRPRTIYVLHRRYQSAARWAAVIGAAVGVAIVVAALGPALLAGEPLPPASFAIGLGIIALAALLPYALVRRRWRRIKEDHDD